MSFNIADLFEHAVDLMPERTALICGDRRLTFAELEDRSNRLAHHLAFTKNAQEPILSETGGDDGD